MNWEAVGALGEVLGALAVFLTLIYLALQVKQHTRAMDETRKSELARNAQLRTQNRLEMHRLAIENPDLRNAIDRLNSVDSANSADRVKVLDDLTHDEYQSYRHFLSIQVLIIENLWYQGQQELIDSTIVENIYPAMANYGHVWKAMGSMNTVREEFREAVDRVLAESSAG